MVVSVLGELRGLERKVSSKGNEYFVFHCEDVDSGKPFDLSSKTSFSHLGLSKGMVCCFTCGLFMGRDWCRLDVMDISVDVSEVA